MDQLDETADRALDSDSDDVSQVCDAVRGQDGDWQEGSPVELSGGLRWKPDLVRPGGAVLHVHLADRLRGYVFKRLAAASEAGIEPHVALPLTALDDENLLEELTRLEVVVHVLAEGLVPEPPDLLLGALSGHGRRPAVLVTEPTRIRLGQLGWDACAKDGTSSARGKRLEVLLAFLFSQVEGLAVWDRNLRTDTEELDVVVIQRETGGRCWSLPGTKFMIVECKNWSTRVGQPQVSNLRVKMQGRRGTVRIGVLVAASEFTSDAMSQELRFASDDLTIALVGPTKLQELIGASDLTDALERVIGDAMLR